PVMCTSSSIGGRLLLPVFLSAPDSTPTPARNRQAELGPEPGGESERHHGCAVPAAAPPGPPDRPGTPRAPPPPPPPGSRPPPPHPPTNRLRPPGSSRRRPRAREPPTSR